MRYHPAPMPIRAVAIHGHFYQPPRENPWLEAVETQDSAYPYHDWNERITAECYAPNATARILDASGRILGIVNNYAWISFNFGPTLLSWLEACAPETYAAILEADRISRERFSGHGSAIAQAYNHMILPLANDARQAHAGALGHRATSSIASAASPKAMWLPETAVDIASLEALADAGHRVHDPRAASGGALAKDRRRRRGRTDTSIRRMPYLCRLPSGAVDRDLLLRRPDLARRRLRAAARPRREPRPPPRSARSATRATHPQLVHIATDGETYGHHHRYGDMALAYALQLIEDASPTSRSPTTASILAQHPPTHEVQIVENTSWSCAHGVERWRSDCGCNTGGGPGWNQEWRAPLRDALDWLRDEVDVIFEREGARVLRDPGPRATTTSTSSSTAPTSSARALPAAATPSAARSVVDRSSSCWRCSATRCSCTRAAAGSSTTSPASRPCRCCSTPAASIQLAERVSARRARAAVPRAPRARAQQRARTRERRARSTSAR